MVDEVEKKNPEADRGVEVSRFDDGFLIFVDGTPLKRDYASSIVAEIDAGVIREALESRDKRIDDLICN